MKTQNTPLPQYDQFAEDKDADQIRAQLAMIAARDVANLLVKHALSLADAGATEEARAFDHQAKIWRDRERNYALQAGLID